ncbi:glutathione-independent formaldehyde dehydrogenase [Hyphomicrobium sp. ghe19]|uniref:glutathione-independent formaldehyde dehydrogenase n=1 Tax=Hyphomicrobium sp. ghe19 TaxID=2682968 RepID=UPI001367328E|nr:Glutathione-independent formaldehyde dehydrogenase [Hyphomicrobium sp. ghe19]
MANNRAVTFMGPGKMEVRDAGYPKLADPKGRKIEHAAILKLVTTNICGSDLHIYNGRFEAPAGMLMGHENTGEVVEVGSHVQHIKKGDICSVPFNVACGTCDSCRDRHTDVCLRANEDLGFCGAYGFNLGGWQGGQAEYMLVPWADFQLLRFPDKDEAIEKIRDLTLLSDILPTGYHGCVEANIRTGSTVYIAGAGPVGRCAAASAQLLGASCIIVGDENKARLDLVKNAGYEIVDTSSATPIPDQIESILGKRWVDGAVDCVGLECHGNGPDGSKKNEVESVINTLMEVVKPAGAMGVPGVYTNMDPGAPNSLNKQGKMALDLPKAWVKSPKMTAGQCPVMRYNRELMMAIIWGRMPTLTSMLNTEVISLDDAPKAYETFGAGAANKFVIDPHNMTRLAGKSLRDSAAARPKATAGTR